MWKVLAAAFIFTVGFSTATSGADDHIFLSPDALNWQPPPREWFVGTLPAGLGQGRVAIVYGDPNKAGEPFIIRIKSVPGGSVLPVHWHEIDEHITVLSGVWCAGTGDKIDPKACTDMPAGSYIFMPKRMHHWAVTKDSVVELHGVGPFRAYLVQ